MARGAGYSVHLSDTDAAILPSTATRRDDGNAAPAIRGRPGSTRRRVDAHGRHRRGRDGRAPSTTSAATTPRDGSRACRPSAGSGLPRSIPASTPSTTATSDSSSTTSRSRRTPTRRGSRSRSTAWIGSRSIPTETCRSTSVISVLRQQRPFTYQDGPNGRAGGRESLRDRRRTGRCASRSASYDTGRPLVIDPVLTYSSYFGGDSEETRIRRGARSRRQRLRHRHHGRLCRRCRRRTRSSRPAARNRTPSSRSSSPTATRCRWSSRAIWAAATRRTTPGSATPATSPSTPPERPT